LIKDILFERKVKEDKPEINLKMKKVLVVDDFFNFRLTVKNMMRSLGIMYIDDAATGEEALKTMAVRQFDIILCDYNLGPGKSGQQVLEEGKFRGYISYATVFIMVTAENTSEMIMGAMEYEPDDYLMKPFAKEVLEKRIRKIAARKENIRDIEKAIIDHDFDHALRLCDELLARSASNISEIMKFKGEVLLKKGEYNKAAEFYDKILLMGNVAWAQLGRGRVDFLSGNYEQAKETFEQIIAQNDKIMAAYDYLAKTLLKMNCPLEAQDVLMKAIAISPRALLRQKDLGNIAYRNEDFKTAETSFKAAVEHGKHSCFKNPSDYTNLAKTLVHGDEPQEGLKVLGNALKEFPDESDTRLHLSIAESYVYTKMNKTDEAKRALADAQKFAAEMEGDIPGNLSLDLAQACLATGDTKKGMAIIKNIVESNHDNDEILDNVRYVFKEMGMVDKGEALIETTQSEIIRLNNKGVKLAQDGKLTEAIAYFEKAAEHLPENKIINANAAQVLMLYMKGRGVNEQQLAKAKTYLDRVRKIDENYTDYAALLAMHRELAAGN
jgi:tetratricopeptide (TPR) repeat protein